jgi:thymidylate synthase ThyX
MTINTRNLRWAIVKLASSDLKEFNEIGAELKQCAENITPTLLKHAEKNEFIEKNSTLLKELSIKLITGTKQQKENTVDLVEYDKNGEDKIICSILYKNTGLSYLEIKQKVINLSKEEKGDIIQKAFEGLGKFDIPIRETEMPEYIFDILMDYGAFRDVQRHRICTQINPDLDVDYGYSIPEDVIEAGMEADYKSCMEKAKETFTKIKEKFPKEAQYVVPLAYRKRVLIKMNFREAFHFIRLRSGKQGHASYRKIAQNMYDLIKDVHPMLGKQLVVDKT